MKGGGWLRDLFTKNNPNPADKYAISDKYRKYEEEGYKVIWVAYPEAEYIDTQVRPIQRLVYNDDGTKIDSIFVLTTDKYSNGYPELIYPYNNNKPSYTIDDTKKVIKIPLYDSKDIFIEFPLHRIETIFERLYKYDDTIEIGRSAINKKLSKVIEALQNINLSDNFLSTGTVNDTIMMNEIEAVITQIKEDNAQATYDFNRYSGKELNNKIESIRGLITKHYNSAGEILLRYNMVYVTVSVGGKKKTHSKRL